MFGINFNSCLKFESKKRKTADNNNQLARINIGELIIRQIDMELARKSRLESKTVGYLAILVFTLTVLTQLVIEFMRYDRVGSTFFGYIISMKWYIGVFFVGCLLSCVFTYYKGIRLLFSCVKTLKTDQLSFWKLNKLEEYYWKVVDGDLEALDDVVKGGININKDNLEYNQKLSNNVNDISNHLFCFAKSFVISAALIFIKMLFF